MSKKDYVRTAKELRVKRPHFESRHGAEAFREMVEVISDIFKSENSRFDWDLFHNTVYGE